MILFSESEEDVIDVVTIDTRTHSNHTLPVGLVSAQVNGRKRFQSSHIQDDLQAVVNKLNRDTYKRPKCMSDHEFALPSKKSKKYSENWSMQSSQNSSDGEEFEGKRSAHNVMERQRRNDLKNSLLSLRACLPSLNSQERAPKVVILSHATKYVTDLLTKDRRLQAEVKNLQLRNLRLKQRLSFLQSRTGSNLM